MTDKIEPAQLTRTRAVLSRPSNGVRVGKRERIGNASMECLECRATIDTASAAFVVDIPGGLQFLGVRCACGASFTVELMEPPKGIPSNAQPDSPGADGSGTQPRSA